MRTMRAYGWASVALIGGYLLAGIGHRAFDVVQWHDWQRLLQLALLPALALPLVFLPALQSRASAVLAWLGAAAPALVLLALSLGAVSAATSGFARQGSLECAVFALLGATTLAVAVARSALGLRFDAAMLIVFSATAAALALSFTVAYAAALFSDAGFAVVQLYNFGFSNPRFLGQFQTLVLPLLAAACVAPSIAPRYRSAAFVVLALTWVLAMVSMTRAIWPAFAIGMAAGFVLCPRGALRIAVAQVAAIAVAFPLSTLLLEVIPPLLGHDPGRFFADAAARLADSGSIAARGELWARALELTALHPWLGVGPMGLALDAGATAAHPHNAALQIAAEWGIPAALAAAAAAVILGVRTLQASNLGQRGAADPVALALPIALAAAAAHSMIDGVIVMPYTQVAAVVLAGWAIGMAFAESRCDRDDASRVAGASAGAIALLATIVVFVAVRPDLGVVNDREQRLLRACPACTNLGTRFWTYGVIIGEVSGATRMPLPAGLAPGAATDSR